MPYVVAFQTMSTPNPNRLGTAEERTISAVVWAIDAEVAISEAKRLCAEAGREFIRCLDASVPVSTLGHTQIPIAREMVLNDPMCTLKLGDLE
jgi:hypothetical protein